MIRILVVISALIATAVTIAYTQGVPPGELVAQLSDKAFAVLYKKSAAPENDEHKTPTPASKPKNVEKGVPAVTVATVERADFVETILVTGSIVARDTVLVTPEVDGLRVTGYEAEEGDTVTQGQVLARLEHTTLQSSFDQNAAAIARADAAIAQAESQITEAQAVLKEAQAQLTRAKPLKKSGYLSGSTYDQREAAAKSARARLTSAENGQALATAEKNQLIAQRRELEWRLARAVVRAPVAGLISKRNVRIGEVTSSARPPMYEIIKDGEVELEAEVDAPNLAKIRANQTASVSVAGHTPATGTVRLVSPEVDKATRLGHAYIFIGADSGLNKGAFARGRITTAKSNGLSIPASAVLYDDSAPSVLKVENGAVSKTPIKLGLRSHGRVEIREGLSAGDQVVAKAGTFLRDGDRIHPMPDTHAVHIGSAQ